MLIIEFDEGYEELKYVFMQNVWGKPKKLIVLVH
jgi:hypothetical protein